jgi:hypothetical protein
MWPGKAGLEAMLGGRVIGRGDELARIPFRHVGLPRPPQVRAKLLRADEICNGRAICDRGVAELIAKFSRGLDCGDIAAPIGSLTQLGGVIMKHIIMLAACCAALAACATVTRGTKTAFVVETVPSGAHVRLSTGQECNATPCTFPGISREAEFMVTVSKPGYRTTEHAVTHRTAGGGSAGMAGNVLVGGLIGAAIDANSGATQDLVPNPLVVHMEAEAVVATPAVATVAAPAAEATPAVATEADAAAAPAEAMAAEPAAPAQ